MYDCFYLVILVIPNGHKKKNSTQFEIFCFVLFFFAGVPSGIIFEMLKFNFGTLKNIILLAGRNEIKTDAFRWIVTRLWDKYNKYNMK